MQLKTDYRSGLVSFVTTPAFLDHYGGGSYLPPLQSDASAGRGFPCLAMTGRRTYGVVGSLESEGGLRLQRRRTSTVGRPAFWPPSASWSALPRARGIPKPAPLSEVATKLVCVITNMVRLRQKKDLVSNFQKKGRESGYKLTLVCFVNLVPRLCWRRRPHPPRLRL